MTKLSEKKRRKLSKSPIGIILHFLAEVILPFLAGFFITTEYGLKTWQGIVIGFLFLFLQCQIMCTPILDVLYALFLGFAWSFGFTSSFVQALCNIVYATSLPLDNPIIVICSIPPAIWLSIRFYCIAYRFYGTNNLVRKIIKKPKSIDVTTPLF